MASSVNPDVADAIPKLVLPPQAASESWSRRISTALVRR